MKGEFSTYLKKKKPILKQLINRLNETYPFVSVLGTDVSGVIIEKDRSSTQVVPSGITESGFVVKVYDGTLYSEYSFNQIQEENLDEMVSKIHEYVQEKGSIPHVKVGMLQEEDLTETFIRKNRGKTYTTDHIIDKLKFYVDDTLAYSDLIVNVRIAIEMNEISKLYLSTKKDLEQYYTWTYGRVFVLTRRESNTKYGYESYGHDSVEECLETLKESTIYSADIAIALLDSTTPEPGVYEVITDPSITGLIAHEAFGHGVEMDMFVKDRALAQSYINKSVASSLVSMRDGASAVHSAASYFFDDDGVLAQDTQIINQGTLVTGISDALSALQLGTTPTGNGRRESYKRKAYTRMTNTFFESGQDDLEEMIKSIQHGYLISETNNGMEDPKNWGIQCTAHYGKEIKDGKFTGKIVSPVVMSGHVIELLNSISAVSKDFKIIGSGGCGKGYKEWVRVSDGGPYLKAKVKIG